MTIKELKKRLESTMSNIKITITALKKFDTLDAYYQVVRLTYQLEVYKDIYKQLYLI